jgi:histidinol-phosphatase (PHP family)
MIPNDTHTHTYHSPDGHDSVDEMCRHAVSKGLKYICFTEHYDAVFETPEKIFYNFEKHSEDIEEAREKYEGKLTVLKGIEFGEPHMYQDVLKKMHQRDFDTIIGSVHSIRKTFITDPVLTGQYSTAEIYDLYFQEIIAAIEAGGFDVLGHLDFPARYIGEYYTISPTMESLIAKAVEKGVVPEINTSPLRKGFDFVMPGKDTLAIYKDLGGKYIACGSDAHRAIEVGADFDTLEQLIKHFGFTPVIFVQREMQELALI